MPFILTMYVGDKQTLKAVIVADAIWCGLCRPQGDPIEMHEFY
ncbi:MAG: hypothetical protein SGI73_11820 [Chloroflexota bacterium]|nr:hypothetical protein [Chloroflexota bacterium]